MKYICFSFYVLVNHLLLGFFEAYFFFVFKIFFKKVLNFQAYVGFVIITKMCFTRMVNV